MDIIKRRARNNKWKSALSIGASVIAVAVSAGILYTVINEANTKKGE